MFALLTEHGPNQWNFLPEDGVKSEMQDVADGRAAAILAKDGEKIVGFAVAYPGLIRFPKLTTSKLDQSKFGYIGDVVVHPNYSGRGIGSSLLNQAKAFLSASGVVEVHIDCHEENAASRGMMRKAGFEELATFHDPDRRFVGSRRTWLGQSIVNSAPY